MAKRRQPRAPADAPTRRTLPAPARAPARGKSALKPKRKSTRARAAAPAPSADASLGNDGQRPFHGLSVVAISVGTAGAEACADLLAVLPPDLGLAVVVAPQNGTADEQAELLALLNRRSSLPVVQAADGKPLQPDRVHVLPHGTLTAVENGVFRTRPHRAGRLPLLPADFFFRSLAASVGAGAVGVVLCGTDGDGSVGLQEVKGAGGIAIAQEPSTAVQDGAPRAAISTGAVDLVLPPADIAGELVRLARHPVALPPCPDGKNGDDGANMAHVARLFAVLRNATGVDFTHYKPPTIQRRLQRRMLLHKIDRLEKYVGYLQHNPAEVQALYQDLLIKVTRFFREPESFQTLAEKVFPQIARKTDDPEPVRVWVPGCSTGEEPYSIAIALLEYLGDRAAGTPIQIFATDVSEQAVEHARAATYAEAIAADVSPERLRRFFTKTDGKYRVNKMVRDLCVFARQDLTRDPPFSRLDLVVCRNVLIYLGPVLQKRLMTVFHYALKPNGFLMLGAAETTGLYGDLFAIADKHNRVYRKKPAMVRPDLVLQHSGQALPGTGLALARPAAARRPEDGAAGIHGEANRVILSRYAPPGVIVDESFQIVHFRGQTGPFLQPAPGEASLNALKMAREGLLHGLRAALLEARNRRTPVRRPGLRVKSDGQYHAVDLEVVPLSRAGEPQHFLVLFERPAGPHADGQGNGDGARAAPRAGKGGKARARTSGGPAANAARVELLEAELAASREYMQSVIQDLEAANEELQSANEEILSANEELQSTNEELDTAKEELQSTNEELNTLNEELHGRNDELSRANSDLGNLLGSVDIAIVMVDAHLRVRRFTPMAEKVMNLIPTDVGRKIGDIRPNVDVPDLEKLIAEAIDGVRTIEREAHDRNGRWYSLRVRPYKNLENRIDGAVLALIDVEAARKDRNAAAAADGRALAAAEGRDFAEAVVETVREPLLVLDADRTVRKINRAFRSTFHVEDGQIVGKQLGEVLDGHFDTPAFRKVLEHVLMDDAVEDFEVEQEFPKVGRRRLLVNARRLEGDDDRPPLVLMALAEPAATRAR